MVANTISCRRAIGKTDSIRLHVRYIGVADETYKGTAFGIKGPKYLTTYIGLIPRIVQMAPHDTVEEHVPGTVYLVDVNHHVPENLHDHSHQDIILVPHPSSDPNDPLNWAYSRKLLAVSMAYLYVFGMW